MVFSFLQRGVREVFVGRHPENHLVLHDNTVKLMVSRRHAKLMWDGATASYAVRAPYLSRTTHTQFG